MAGSTPASATKWINKRENNMISKETMQQLKENCALATTYNGQLYRNDDDMDYITISRWMEKIYMLLLVMDQDHDAIKDYVENEWLAPWIVNINMGYNKDGEPVSWLDFLLKQDPDNDKYKFDSFTKKT